MTADRRLRIGGWAALLVAVLAPVEVLVGGVTAARPGTLNLTAVSVIELIRFAALLVAVVGLDPMFRSFAAGLASRVRVLGAIAGAALIASAVADLAAIDAGTAGTVLRLAGSVLIGIWFIAGGAILLRQGGGLARIGWTAELGGLGQIVAGVLVAVGITGPGGDGLSWVGWFRILGLFVVVYLVRVWMYVVRGRLPGPGIL